MKSLIYKKHITNPYCRLWHLWRAWPWTAWFLYVLFILRWRPDRGVCNQVLHLSEEWIQPDCHRYFCDMKPCLTSITIMHGKSNRPAIHPIWWDSSICGKNTIQISRISISYSIIFENLDQKFEPDRSTIYRRSTTFFRAFFYLDLISHFGGVPFDHTYFRTWRSGNDGGKKLLRRSC